MFLFIRLVPNLGKNILNYLPEPNSARQSLQMFLPL